MKPHKVIETLRADGHQVKVQHLRVPAGWTPSPYSVDEIGDPRSHDVEMLSVRDLHASGREPATRGGITRVAILDAAGSELATGCAPCSLHDNFDRGLGLTIAVGRAVHELNGGRRPRA